MNDSSDENKDNYKNYLKMIFWIGFNDSKKYKTKLDSSWDQKAIDAYMEGQEFFMRHKLGVPFVDLNNLT